MRVSHGPTMGGAWMLTAVLVATACHPSASKIRSEGLARQLREVTLTAERDSLLGEVAANGKLLSDIQTELTKVQPRPGPGSPESPSLELTKDQRTYALERVREITGRLRDAEAKLALTERRTRRLTRTADSLAAENTAAKSSIADLAAVVASQRETITALTTQVEGLTTDNLVLSDSVYRLTDDHNTAYYAIGTRRELLARGVIVEDGHRSIPLIGKRGVQPARRLPVGEFTSIDRSATRSIPLPRADRSYRIVSRQNLSHVTSRSRGQEVRDSIAIASPEEFWEASKYLIVVQE